jgi:hypothetical protein
MPVPGVDAERIVATLLAHDVRFVVVGGFAVELWDVAVQPTVDVDVTPEVSHQNLKRLADALNELEASLRVDGDEIDVPGGLSAELIGRMSVLNLVTDAGPLDLTILPAGTDGFPDLVRNSTELPYRGVMVPTASLADVARSKEAAGRPKDLRTLPAIYAHLQRLKNEDR